MSILRDCLEIDAQISRKLQIAEKPGVLRTTAILFAHSGDSWFWFLGIILLWIWGSPAWKIRVEAYTVGILITALVVMVIKFSVRRKRPAGEWGKFYRWTDPNSFPSGHSARAMMLAILGLALGPLWWGLVLLAWVPMVSFARISMGVHYLMDILAGLVVGLIIGILGINLFPLL